jgi:hypothetical protein
MTMTINAPERAAHLSEPAAQPEPAPARQPRGYARVLSLTDLMIRRPDLMGVYKPADVAAEAIRWSA